MRMMTAAEATRAAGKLVVPGQRRLLGIAGEPGAGKSTLANRIAEALNAKTPSTQALDTQSLDTQSPNTGRAADDAPAAIVVPMDGFHLAQHELERLGRADRKGAPDTFDSWGFLAMLARLADGRAREVYAPRYARELHNPIAGAIRVPRETPLVIIEGNYLLLPHEPWALARRHFTQIWQLNLDEQLRRERLIARHIEFGKTPEAARRWALGPDERNASLVRAQAGRADALVTLDQ